MAGQRNIRRIKIQREAEGYLELGMVEHAMQSLERLGDPASFDSQSLYLWGECLRLAERYDEALHPLVRASKASPDHLRVAVSLAWCYKRTGRLDRAIETLEEALIFHPDEALLRYNLACYLSLAGQKRRALRYLAKALSLDPAYAALVDEEPDFDPIRSDPAFQALLAELRGQERTPHQRPFASS